MLLIGISTSDTHEDVAKLTKKIINLRIFEDMTGQPISDSKWYGKPWSKSILDLTDHKILSVSQFTLYGTIKKGTKPDFHKAAKGDGAILLYNDFLKALKKEIGEERVEDGKFGEMMDVELINDGPVTIVWDTKE